MCAYPVVVAIRMHMSIFYTLRMVLTPPLKPGVLPQYVKVGIVGGSDQVKICEQLGPNGRSPYQYCV